MSRWGRIWLIALALHIAGAFGVASAQTKLGDFNVEGEAELGGRWYIDRPPQSSRAKLEEYRDLSPGVVLFGLNFRLLRPDESLYAEFGGSKWGYSDQDYYLSVGRLGTWQFDFLWDQTPHVISTNARLLATEPQRGVFVLPSPRPALNLHNSAPDVDEISVRWDKALMRFAYSVSPNLDVIAEYTRIRKEGDKPMGMAFGSPGANFYEVLQPIEQTIHDFRLRGTFADPRYQLQFAYGLSIFENDLTRMRADNPCVGNGAPCSGGEAGGPGTGQSSLPPSNMAHSLSVAGGVNLPLRTRINANVAWGLHLQNDAFLPHTINQAIAGDPSLALPSHSLNGLVQTWLVYLSATSRPFDIVTLGARYRFYDYSDQSRQLTFAGTAVDDNALGDPRRAGRWSWQKHNGDVDARWRLLESVALTTGLGWERWDRDEQREVPISDEYFAKVALDVTPTEWLLARLTYTPSFRRISRYNTFAHLQQVSVEDPGAAAEASGQSVFLRKFDEANRDRQKVDAQLQLTLGNSFTATPSVGYHTDDYIDSRLGLQHETGWVAGIDLSWKPVELVGFSAGYTYERLSQTMRSRSRPVAGGSPIDSPDFDWVSDITDTVHTVYAGVKAALIPKMLDLRFDANYSTSLGRIDNSNPTQPVTGTAAQNNTATVQKWPAFEDTLLHLETALIYYFDKNWAAKLGYAFEMFNQSDWRTNLSPFLPGVSSIWLGNTLRDYTAHMMGASLSYRFK
jgi:MtrB/PioB family decaheme-associated outer membrane protein